ncbi:MAG: protein kinase [Pirellulales bacterium]|nr:protein kinase [Pirellulales bacterium]
MAESSSTEFERCAVASGLLTREQIDEVVAMLRPADGRPDDDGQEPDAQWLARKLVEVGYLNPWQAKQLLEGRTRFTLGPYRIVDWLGRGGMGHVFRAEHGVLRRSVAIKVLPRERSTPEAIDNFTREIRAQAALNHENLVRAFDAGHDGNVYYLVSEYVPGTDLRKLVRRAGPLSMETSASIISQVAQGLAHAHEQGLVHRDVKPGNVLVTPDGRAKLSDLGLAGPLTGDVQSDPRFGKVVGTADFLSPDHIQTPWAPTPAWDVYSLGCTFYYAVTSKVPFPGGTTAEKARAHCQTRPLDPRRFNPRLGVEFVDILADMMAKDPQERIPTAAEVVARLAPWVGPIAPFPEMYREWMAGPTTLSIPAAAPSRADRPSPDAADTEDFVPGVDEIVARSDPRPARPPASDPSQATEPAPRPVEDRPTDGVAPPARSRRRILLAVALALAAAAALAWLLVFGP